MALAKNKCKISCHLKNKRFLSKMMSLSSIRIKIYKRTLKVWQGNHHSITKVHWSKRFRIMLNHNLITLNTRSCEILTKLTLVSWISWLDALTESSSQTPKARKLQRKPSQKEKFQDRPRSKTSLLTVVAEAREAQKKTTGAVPTASKPNLDPQVITADTPLLLKATSELPK